MDAAAIAVAGSDGRVTLRGTVGSDPEKRAAGKAGSIVGATPLRISASAGKVTITGGLRSWSQHDDAIAAAWATPGVTELEDRIAVAP